MTRRWGAPLLAFIIMMAFSFRSKAQELLDATPPPTKTATVSPVNDDEEIYGLARALLTERMQSSTAVSEATVQQIYRLAEKMVKKKNKKRDAEFATTLPNPVICANRCIKNCQNKTGFVDVIVSVDPEGCPR